MFNNFAASGTTLYDTPGLCLRFWLLRTTSEVLVVLHHCLCLAVSSSRGGFLSHRGPRKMDDLLLLLMVNKG